MIYWELYKQFEKETDLLLNYQLARHHLHSNGSIKKVVGEILSKKFCGWKNSIDSRSVLSSAPRRTTIGRVNFEEDDETILKKYIKKNFDSMVYNARYCGGDYPLKFKKMIENNIYLHEKNGKR